MERFIICKNPLWRLVVDLRTDNRILKISELIINQCPECGSEWSSLCPFLLKGSGHNLASGAPAVFTLFRGIKSTPGEVKLNRFGEHRKKWTPAQKHYFSTPGNHVGSLAARGPTYSNRMYSTSRLACFELHRFPVRAGVRPYGRLGGGAP
jgi:hypothetical protein